MYQFSAFQKPQSYIFFKDLLKLTNVSILERCNFLFNNLEINNFKKDINQIIEKRALEAVKKVIENKIDLLKMYGQEPIFKSETQNIFDDFARLITEDSTQIFKSFLIELGKIESVDFNKFSNNKIFQNSDSVQSEFLNQLYDFSFKNDEFNRDILLHLQNSLKKPLEKYWIELNFYVKEKDIKKNLLPYDASIHFEEFLNSYKKQVQKIDEQMNLYLSILEKCADDILNDYVITENNCQFI
ncbi:hypothetical protein GVAV_000914 [Gurleya vavrai]